MAAAPTIEGRVALVTGASGGIGRAISLRLAAEGVAVGLAFASEAAIAQRLAREIAAEGGRAVTLGSDLRRSDASDELVTAVERELGSIDILVANAAVGRIASYEEVDAAMFDETLAVNLRAPYLLVRRVLPGMRERRFGRILFTS